MELLYNPFHWINYEHMVLGSKITSLFSLIKIFTGNVDSNSIVSHLLSPYITARFIRIIPVTWNRYIALRVEFYGCREGNQYVSIYCYSASTFFPLWRVT